MGKTQGRIAALFLAPYLCFFLVLRLGPTLVGLFASLTSWNIVGSPTYIGLRNFTTLAQDQTFAIAVKNTLYFLLLAGPALVVGSLLLAVMMNQKIPGKRLVRTAIFIPYAVMPAIVGVIWNWMDDPHFGLINYYLGKLGIAPIAWLADPTWAMPAIAIATVWWLAGYNMIIYLAGLQDIPDEVYEAATVDGARTFQMFWHITVPLLRPTTMIVTLLTAITLFQIFDQVLVMTGGGPGTSTLTIVQYLYVQAFQNFNLGYGAAVGVAIFVALVAVGVVQRWYAQRGEVPT
jgi:multiple sugar transport system permease protein